MTHFDWDVDQAQKNFFAFNAALIKFRTECPLLGRDEFLKPDEITWHEDDWQNKSSKFLAFTLHGKYASDVLLKVREYTQSCALCSCASVTSVAWRAIARTMQGQRQTLEWRLDCCTHVQAL
jgi:pullulanase/glycogen debranching enzyme